MSNRIIWSVERGPFGHGMIMREDGLFINLEKEGSFRIMGKNLRIKQLKKRVEIQEKDDEETT